jgi:hypothetical protein
MRGKTLGQLVTMLRAECRHSVIAAMGQNNLPTLEQVLRRTQESLWDEHAWPFLMVERDEALMAGQRYYAFDPDLAFERVDAISVKVKYGGNWKPVGYGIGLPQYNASDSDTDVRNDPICRWQAYEGDMYEVWPIPASNSSQSLRMRGVKKLSPFIAASDRADLDDNLIVLFAAAEILTNQGAKDAQAKTLLAQRRLERLKGQQQKRGMFVMGGGVDPRMTGTYPTHPLFGRKV